MIWEGGFSGGHSAGFTARATGLGLASPNLPEEEQLIIFSFEEHPVKGGRYLLFCMTLHININSHDPTKVLFLNLNLNLKLVINYFFSSFFYAVLLSNDYDDGVIITTEEQIT